MTSVSIPELMREIGQRARVAYQSLAAATAEQKESALREAAAAIRTHKAEILAANEKDYSTAKVNGVEGAMLDRLLLDDKRIESMAAGLEVVAALPDPVGKVLETINRPNGLVISRVSVPLGVIGIIYEARPNVTADAGALALKAGNAVILRGGSDSFHSSSAIAACLHEGLKSAGLPQDAIQLVPTNDRAAVGEMLTMVGVIDVIVPRGGRSLTERVQRESRVPTFLHLDGNCHTYIHSAADFDMARKVLFNAKLRRLGICGATESLLIDESIAPKLLPLLVDDLQGCEFRGDEASRRFEPRILAASDDDWGMEYLAAILSVKVVRSVEEAIHHINRYGSHHTDAIITEDTSAAARFTAGVDSAIVMVNASTQFADGGEFGMGAEIGIATGRMHARGPVGAAQLTTYKYVVQGNGQVRAV
ncbi:MAG: glutamate-5-semialdehyde dehydrogenase [Alphaproteobacteria bacterium]|nr:glutamate-5-semialdehyde dehydrogenase [Alphaproteobacteria bacterium]